MTDNQHTETAEIEMNQISEATQKIIARAKPVDTAPSETTAIIQVIERAAMNPNVDIDKMERLLQMQERVMERNAKADFASAFSIMQPELPAIPERGRGHNDITYALWEDINDLIKPVLAQYGFALSFRTGRENDKLTVTAILSHTAGHSEETTLELAADTSGNKNNVQAIGSSTAYGKRYTAQAILNLTSRGEDDDGFAAGVGEPVNGDQLKILRAKIDETYADTEKFCTYLKVPDLPSLPASRFDEAMKALEAHSRQPKKVAS